MKIVKYTRLASGKYKVLFNNKKELILYESVIIDTNLLYKKEITNEEYNNLVNLNNYQDIYNKVIKYIGIRLRSKKEITDYLKKMDLSTEVVDDILNKLITNKYIDDERFSYAYIKDKYNFSNNGPYKIINELVKLGIDKDMAYTYTFDIITNEEEKINKLINKYVKSDKKHDWYYLRNKIYNNLINLGYSKEIVISILNNYN
mgnify:FL=1